MVNEEDTTPPKGDTINMASQDDTKPPVADTFVFDNPAATAGLTATFEPSLEQYVLQLGPAVSAATQKVMRENPDRPSSPPSIPTRAPPGSRPIAPLRKKKVDNPVTMEDLKQRLTQSEKRNQEMKEELKEEQITKQHKINEQQKLIDKQGKTIDKQQKSIKEQQITIEGLQKTTRELQKIVGDLQKENENNPYKKALELHKHIAEKQGKENELLKKIVHNLEQTVRGKLMAESKKQAAEASKIEELQRDLNEYKRKLEVIQTDYDSLQVQLQEAEKELSTKAETIRVNQTKLANNEAAISDLELQLSENKNKVKDLQATVRERNMKVQEKDRDIKDLETELEQLTSQNKEWIKANQNLKSDNDKSKQQLRTLKSEIEGLRYASRDNGRLEEALAEANANVIGLQEEVNLLEKQNVELRATIDELSIKGIGTLTSLQTELAGADNVDEEILSTTPNDGDSSLLSGPPSKPLGGQSGKIKQGGDNPSQISVSGPLEALPVIIRKDHNPIHCWVQVYIDLWTLFVFWLGHSSIVASGRSNSTPPALIGLEAGLVEGVSAHAALDAALAKRETAGKNVPAAVLEREAPTVPTNTPASVDIEKPEVGLPPFWTTIFALYLHLMFYAFVYVCVSNYRSVLHERSVWLAANELTRRQFLDFYKIRFRRGYGTLHWLLGDVRWLATLQYNVHSWIQVSRALPY